MHLGSASASAHLRRPAPSRRLADIRQLLGLKRRLAARRRRPLLAAIAVPLAAVAAAGTVQWFAVLPLGFAAWWWAPGFTTWLIAAEASWVGIAWAIGGTAALSAWPRARLAVGSLWIGTAAAWAAGSALSRQNALAH